VPAAEPEVTDRASFDECVDDTRRAGATQVQAVEHCVPDRARWRVCLGPEPIAPARVQTCALDQFADTPVATDDAPATTEVTATTGREGWSDPADPVDPTVADPTVPAGPATTTGGGGAINPDLVIEDEPLPGDGDGGGGGLAWPFVGLLAVAVAAAGYLAGRARRSGPTPLPAGAAPPADPAAPPVPGSATAHAATGAPAGDAAPSAPEPAGPTDGDAADRTLLVRALVEVADQVTSDAVRTTVVERLAAVGVHPVLAEPGERFDPTRHRGVHATPAADAAAGDTIAALDRPGWRDRDRVLRPPEVVVAVWEEPS